MKNMNFDEAYQSAHGLVKMINSVLTGEDPRTAFLAIVIMLRVRALGMVATTYTIQGEDAARLMSRMIKDMLGDISKELDEFDYKSLLADVNSAFGSSLFNEIIKD